jgi:hypothetical protein
MPFLVPLPITNEVPLCIYKRMLLIIIFLLAKESLDVDQKLNLHHILFNNILSASKKFKDN